MQVGWEIRTVGLHPPLLWSTCNSSAVDRTEKCQLRVSAQFYCCPFAEHGRDSEFFSAVFDPRYPSSSQCCFVCLHFLFCLFGLRSQFFSDCSFRIHPVCFPTDFLQSALQCCTEMHSERMFNRRKSLWTIADIVGCPYFPQWLEYKPSHTDSSVNVRIASSTKIHNPFVAPTVPQYVARNYHHDRYTAWIGAILATLVLIPMQVEVSTISSTNYC